VPGRRNYAREVALHALVAPSRYRSHYGLLTTYLPQQEAALVGRPAVLAYLHSLGLTRPNGGPITWWMVKRWTRRHDFPLLRATWRPRHRCPCLSTSFAITAWVLSRLDSDQRHLFRVHSLNPQSGFGGGNAPSVSENVSSPGARRAA
jgi:hypothetical protein